MFSGSALAVSDTGGFAAPGQAGQTVNGTESNVQIPIPVSGTLDNLQVVTGGASGSGHSFQVIVRVAGTSTALTCTTVSNTGTTCSGSTGVAVTAGQLLSIDIPNDGAFGTRTTQNVEWSLTLQ